MTELTTRQREVLDFIVRSIKRRGYAPTVREMMDHFGFSGPNGMRCHLKALKKKGFIEWEPRTARSIRVTERLRGLPLLSFEELAQSGGW